MTVGLSTDIMVLNVESRILIYICVSEAGYHLTTAVLDIISVSLISLLIFYFHFISLHAP